MMDVFDRIFGVLLEIKDLLKRSLPEGEIERYTVELSEVKPSESLIPPVTPWYSVFVTNSGPGSVTVSPMYGNPVELDTVNNEFRFNPGSKCIKGLSIYLSSGSSASVQVFCVR